MLSLHRVVLVPLQRALNSRSEPARQQQAKGAREVRRMAGPLRQDEAILMMIMKSPGVIGVAGVYWAL